MCVCVVCQWVIYSLLYIFVSYSYFLYSFLLFSRGCSVIVGLLATLPRAASLQEFAGL